VDSSAPRSLADGPYATGEVEMTKKMWIGIGVVAAAAWCWSATAQTVYTGDPALGLGSGELITHFQEQPSGLTVVTIVDPQERILAVYHISQDSAEVKLRAVRNIGLDLRLEEYNGVSPKADEIRRGLARAE
jgi:hypothetical protein